MGVRETMANRLSWSCRLMLLVLGVAFVSFIARLDASDRQRDFDLFTVIEHVNQCMKPKLLGRTVTESAVLKLAEPEYPGTAEAYRNVKARFARWLRDSHVIISKISKDDNKEAGESSGPGGTGRSADPPDIPLAGFLAEFDEQWVMEAELGDDDGVSLFIDRFEGLTNKRLARVVVALKGEPPEIDGRELPPFFGLSLGHESIGVGFGDPEDIFPENTVYVPAKVRSVSGRRYAPWRNRRHGSMARLMDVLEKHGLEGGDDMAGPLRLLREDYGGMPMGLAKEAAAREALDAHGKVSILGFAFSTRRFPLATAAVLVVLSFGILVTVASARRRSASGASGASGARGGGAVEVIVGSFVGRLTMWVFLPPATVWLSLPQRQLGSAESIVALAGGGFAALLGLRSLVLSRRLWATMAPSDAPAGEA